MSRFAFSFICNLSKLSGAKNISRSRKAFPFTKNILLLFLACCSTLNAAEKKPHGLHGFVENKGQVRNQFHEANTAVLYLYAMPDMNIQLKKNGFSYDTRKRLSVN
jgi:hypothetical protein